MSKQVFSDLPLVLTVPQLADVLNIGRNSAYDIIRSGRIKSIRIGHQIRISRTALLEFLDVN
ncbi:helix-turn-helix domain-containing protein [Dysosmobacter sp. Sow4_B12]|uniref:helix-turn-helix domain-containing protein n=1 Tax=Dysosmobacter sp. Sow4_B12 TaxID=3438777 RepID=UPI003F91EEB8